MAKSVLDQLTERMQGGDWDAAEELVNSHGYERQDFTKNLSGVRSGPNAEHFFVMPNNSRGDGYIPGAIEANANTVLFNDERTGAEKSGYEFENTRAAKVNNKAPSGADNWDMIKERMAHGSHGQDPTEHFYKMEREKGTLVDSKNAPKAQPLPVASAAAPAPSPAPPPPAPAVSPAQAAPTPKPAPTARLEDFKDPNKFFRVIRGEEAFNDIVESGQVRNRPPVPGVPGQISLDNRPTAFPSFAKGEVAVRYAEGDPNHYIISSSDPSIKPSTEGRHGKGSTHFPTDETGKHLPSLDASKVDVYRHIGDGNYELAHTGGKPIPSAAAARRQGGFFDPPTPAPTPAPAPAAPAPPPPAPAPAAPAPAAARPRQPYELDATDAELEELDAKAKAWDESSKAKQPTTPTPAAQAASSATTTTAGTATPAAAPSATPATPSQAAASTASAAPTPSAAPAGAPPPRPPPPPSAGATPPPASPPPPPRPTVTTAKDAMKRGQRVQGPTGARNRGSNIHNNSFWQRELHLSSQGLIGGLASVANDFGLNRRIASYADKKASTYTDSWFGKSLSGSGYVHPVEEAGQVIWKSAKTLDAAERGWAQHISSTAQNSTGIMGALTKSRAFIHGTVLGGQGSMANKALTALGGAGSTIAPLMAAGFAINDARQGYREGGILGAASGAATGYLTGALVNKVISGVLLNPAAGLIGGGLLAATMYTTHKIFDVRNKGVEYLRMGRMQGLTWDKGPSPGMSGANIASMRQRSLNAMENSRFNAMKAIGNESYMMSAPKARYSNSTAINSIAPMLSY